MIAVSKECGLDINKSKSNIIVYNMKEEPTSIESIEVKSSFKYLGVTVENTRNMFKKQKSTMIEKAQKMANMTYSVIAKSCNKLLIGNTFWKGLVLPSVLYGTNMIFLTENEIRKLQVIENRVFCKILGAPKYVPNCAIRGDVGASLMITRIISGRLRYLRGILQGKNEMLKEMIGEMREGNKNKWMRTTMLYLEQVGLTMDQVMKMTKEAVRKHMKQWDRSQWRDEVQSKTSLNIYRSWKEEMEEEDFLDNNPKSVVLFRARSNCLPLNDRKRYTGEDTTCQSCMQECETIRHLILSCPAYGVLRSHSILLQQPYSENEDEIIGRFLFCKEDIEDKKEVLYRIWQERCREMKKSDPTKPHPSRKPHPLPHPQPTRNQE